MELKSKKFINNTGRLPRYDIGRPSLNTDANTFFGINPLSNPLNPSDSTLSTGSGGNINKTGTFSNYTGIPGIISGVIGTGAAIYDAHQFDTNRYDYINKYGRSQQYVGDVGYDSYNDINRSAELDVVNKQNTKSTLTAATAGAGTGAAIGTMIAPGIGTIIGGIGGALIGGIGGLLGGKSKKAKAKEELRKAQQIVDNRNEQNRSGALTEYLQQEQAQKYGDTRSQTLFGYSYGKDKVDPVTGSTIEDHVVETAEGPKYDKQNSWVSQGEGVWNPSTGDANYIMHGPNDTARANLKSDDVVFGSITNPITGNSFKTDAAPYILAKQYINKSYPKSTGWLANQTQDTWNKAVKPVTDEIDQSLTNLANLQKQVHIDNKSQELMKAKCGKNSGSLPGFALKKDYQDPLAVLSPWPNYITSGLGALASLNQYFDAKQDTPYMPDTYVGNRYQNRALKQLAGLRMNTYPIVQDLRSGEARANYAINTSGGLSTAQKHLSRLASLNLTQQNIAKLLSDAQIQNNAYSGTYANSLLQTGESEARRKESARQYDLDYYTKAHAARQQGMQTGTYNFLNQLQQFNANEFERKMSKYMLGLYHQRLSKEQQDLAKGIGTGSGNFSFWAPSMWKNMPELKLKSPWEDDLE